MVPFLMVGCSNIHKEIHFVKNITYTTAILAMLKCIVTTIYFSISVCSKLQFSSRMKKCKCYFLAAIASGSNLYSVKKHLQNFNYIPSKKVPFYGNRVLWVLCHRSLSSAFPKLMQKQGKVCIQLLIEHFCDYLWATIDGMPQTTYGFANVTGKEEL